LQRGEKLFENLPELDLTRQILYKAQLYLGLKVVGLRLDIFLSKRKFRALKHSFNQCLCLYLAVFYMFPTQAWSQVSSASGPVGAPAAQVPVTTPLQAPKPDPTVVAPELGAPQTQPSISVSGPNTSPDSNAPATATSAGPATDASKPAAKKEEKKPLAEPPAVVRPVRKDRAALREQFHLAAWKVGALLRKRLPGVLALRFVEDFDYFQPYQHCGSPFKSEVDLKDALFSLAAAQRALGAFADVRQGDGAPVGFALIGKRAKDQVHGASSSCQPYFSEKVSFGQNASWSTELSDRLMAEVYDAGREELAPPMLRLMTIQDEDPLSTMEIRRYVELVQALRKYSGYLITHAQTFHHADSQFSVPEMVVSPFVGKLLGGIDGRSASTAAEQGIQQGGMGKFKAMRAQEYLPRFVVCAEKATSCGVPAAVPNDSYCFCDPKTELVEKLDDDLLISLQPPDPTKLEKQPHRIYLDAMRKLGIKSGSVQLAAVRSFLTANQAKQFPYPEACRNTEYGALFDDLNQLQPREFWINTLTESVGDYQRKLREGLVFFPVPSPAEFSSFYAKANDIAFSVVADLRKNRWILPEAEVEIRHLIELLPFQDRIREGDKVVGQDLATHFGEKLTVWSYLVQTELSKLDEDDWKNREQVIRKMVREVLVYALSDALLSYIDSVGKGRIPETGEIKPLLATWEKQYVIEWENYLLSTDFAKFLDRIGGRSQTVPGEVTQVLLDYSGFKKQYDADEEAEKIAVQQAREALPLAESAVVADEAASYMRFHEFRQSPIFTALPGTDGISSYVNPWSSSNYYSDEARVKDVSKAPAPFQVPDAAGHEGMYSSFKLDPVHSYDPITGMADPVNGDDYIHVKKGLKGVVSRKAEDLAKVYGKRKISDASLRTSFSIETEKADGTKESVRVENKQVLANAVVGKVLETLDAEPKKDAGLRQLSRTAVLNSVRSWYLGNPSAARTFYEESVKNLAAQIFEKNLRSFLASKPEKNPEAWRKELDRLLNKIDQDQIILGNLTPERIEKLLSDYEIFAAEETEIEKLNSVLVDINDTKKSLLRQNSALDSSEKWVAFCKEFKFGEKKDCLTWFDETADSLTQSTYLKKYFEEKNLSFGSAGIDAGFVRFFGPDKKEKSTETVQKNQELSLLFEGEKTLAELKQRSALSDLSNSETILIDAVEEVVEAGKKVDRPVVLEAQLEKVRPAATVNTPTSYLVVNSLSMSLLEQSRKQTVNPKYIRIVVEKEKLAKLKVSVWTAAGTDPKNWGAGKAEEKPLSGLITIESPEVFAASVRAGEALNAVSVARRNLWRFAWYGMDAGEYDLKVLLDQYVTGYRELKVQLNQAPTDEQLLAHLKVSPENLKRAKENAKNPDAGYDVDTIESPEAKEMLTQVDAFLMELSKRLRAKGNEKKKSSDCGQGNYLPPEKEFRGSGDL